MIQLKSTSFLNFKKLFYLFFTLFFTFNQTLSSSAIAQGQIRSVAQVSSDNDEAELSVEDQAKLLQEQTEIEQVAQAIENNEEDLHIYVLTTLQVSILRILVLAIFLVLGSLIPQLSGHSRSEP